MKRNLLRFLSLVALAVLAAACSTTRETEDLLTRAGFKPVPADTATREAHLKTLPKNQVTSVVRDGKTFYVFPDPAKKVLYFGQQAQYDAYQKLRQQHLLAEQQARAQGLADPTWEQWGQYGAYGAGPMGIPTP